MPTTEPLTAAREMAPAIQQQAGHRLHFTIRQSVKNTWSVWFISLFVALAAWRHVPAWLSLGWALVVGIAYTVRIRYLRGGYNQQVVEANYGVWVRRFATSTLACAAVVALGPVLFFPSASEVTRMYITMLLCCWLAGAMASLGSFPRVYSAYAVFFTGGIWLGWLRSGSAYTFETFVMLGLYAIVVSSFAREFARMVNEGVEIRFVNERLVAEITAAKEAAEEASAAKSRFLAVASHDLRQPLHAVTLLNGLLSRPQSPQSTMEISRHMERSLATLERLFGSVLDFSRLEAASVKPSFGWVALLTLFEQVAAEYRQAAALKGLSLTHDGDAVEIYTDAQLMERVLRNLVENAVKFTDHGSVNLSAGFRGNEFMISVADSGPGIPANLRGEIFKEYFQARDRKADDGLGLGLAIVQHLASLLDVAITVQDNTPQGARFELRLPAGRVREAQGARAAAKPASESVDLAGLTVLCIDDDAASLEALRALLTDWNCRVVLASSSREAHAKVSAEARVDVILSDYDLASGGGQQWRGPDPGPARAPGPGFGRHPDRLDDRGPGASCRSYRIPGPDEARDRARTGRAARGFQGNEITLAHSARNANGKRGRGCVGCRKASIRWWRESAVRPLRGPSMWSWWGRAMGVPWRRFVSRHLPLARPR